MKNEIGMGCASFLARRDDFVAAFQGQTTLINQFAEQQLSTTRVLKRVRAQSRLAALL